MLCSRHPAYLAGGPIELHGPWTHPLRLHAAVDAACVSRRAALTLATSGLHACRRREAVRRSELLAEIQALTLALPLKEEAYA